ncbi:HTH-type transcriptional activator RhaS [Planctomycetes bacterium K2D]|uniref:HTH-type transcriptional activator RhaS n=2 Tax=Botrimarina mediterranea TaxID=2528022 RepID=A0A518K984_9BACT|nr:HTH-type transcriptional activator RhaS [Botrimarina mediterranea]QDV78936.1 HTH-type transcriptional activator RhaS [Planctomycetes bacterium K2D]
MRSLDYPCPMDGGNSSDGRRQGTGQVIPLATAVTDARYCFQGQGAKYLVHDGLRLLCAGRERCLPGFHVARTDFECVLVEFVIDGKGKLRSEGVTHDLFPGMIFSYRMNMAHDIWTGPRESMTKYFAAYEVVKSSAPPEEPDLTLAIAPGVVRWMRDIATMQTLFEGLISDGQLTGKLHQEITALYLELILLKASEAVLPSASQLTAGAEAYERAIACIESDFARITTLDDLGARISLDPNYICRLFRRFGQETPNQCLTRHKLNRAVELLLTQPTSVSDIAMKVGYSDPYYFSRVFKKRFGCSPRAFRDIAYKNAKTKGPDVLAIVDDPIAADD